MWRSKSGLAHHDDSYSRPFASATPCCLLLLACAPSHGSGMFWQSTFTEKSTVFRRFRQALKATMKRLTSRLEQWNSWWENQARLFTQVPYSQRNFSDYVLVFVLLYICRYGSVLRAPCPSTYQCRRPRREYLMYRTQQASVTRETTLIKKEDLGGGGLKSGLQRR